MVSSVEYFSKKRGVFVVLEDFNFNDVQRVVKTTIEGQMFGLHDFHSSQFYCFKLYVLYSI